MNKNRLSSKHKTLHTWLLVFAFLCGQASTKTFSQHALQELSVSGAVVDETNIPLTGVSISVSGTNIGTITDIDGNYHIKVPDEKAVLVFSFIGYTSRRITARQQKIINVTMQEDTKILDEVVIVGYGVQKKSHLTGSITKVKTEGLEDLPVSRIEQALQGRIAGVQIQNTTSEVGEVPAIRVRGMGSISAGDDPLVIIDGFPVADGLGTIDANDIASIEILKDAASAAIYGSRAANGVILITSKSGDVKKPKYSVRASWGTKEAYKLHPIMTAKEYVQMCVNEANLKGTSLGAQDFSFACFDSDTDWQNEALRTANIYNVQFTLSGGGEKAKYYISSSYSDDQGIMINNEYKKLNLRSKIDVILSKKVKVGVNLNPSYSKREKPSTQFIDFYRTPSWLPVRHTQQTAAITGAEVGSYAYGSQFNNKSYTGIDPQTGEIRTSIASPFSSANHNPRMVMDTDHRYAYDHRLQSSGYMTIALNKDFEFNTSNGANIRYNVQEEYRMKDSKQDGVTNRAYYGNTLTSDLLTENTLTYLKKVGDHDFNAMLGFSAQKKTTSTTGLVGINFPTDYITTINAADEIVLFEDSNGESKRVTGTWKEEEALLSYYSRLMYSFKDKYLVSGSIRADGSSKFGDKKRWAWFPSFSFGWRISEEKFMKDVRWIDQLKPRISYGVSGNDKIVNYAKMDMLSSANYSLGTGTGSVAAGLANNSSTLGNDELKWEQSNEYNYGLDFVALNNRINLTVEYYYSITKQLLYKRSLSYITGYSAQWSNLGKVRNKGIEIELSTINIKNKRFEWNTSFNIAANKNKLIDIGGPQQLTNQGEASEIYLARVGDPAIQFFGFKTIGVWKDQAEIDANPSHTSDKPGGLRLWDADGNGSIGDEDRVVLGDPFPDFNWGITNTLKYRDFDLSFLFQGVQGVDVYNGDGRYNESRKWNLNYVSNRWVSEEHPGDGKTPYFTNGFNWMLTDYMIEDGSYIALRDLTLGYALPRKMCKKIGIAKLRVYSSAQNIAFWWASSYRGVNPEARLKTNQYNNPLVDGYQRGGFPIQRTFSLGIDLTF